MNRRFGFALPLVLLVGCSTPPDAPEPPESWVQQVPPPEFSRDLPLEPRRGHDDHGATFCHLGTSCMTMDPRPFEPCLVEGTRRCVDKATEPLLVTEPLPGPPND
jgi:hypothetical protein